MMLSDLLDLDLLDRRIAEGYVRQQKHPLHKRLVILNYSERAAYEPMWDEVTRTCRGLIVRLTSAHDAQVVGRAYDKFFNHNQPEAGALDFNGRVEVTDKADGSLGIGYSAPDGLMAVATRGSFASEQAQHATALLRDRYLGRWSAPDGWTPLWEVLYPANRIVLDYGALDDLMLLGHRHIETGEVVGPNHAFAHEHAWPGPRTTVFPAKSVADAFAMPPRPNAEGVVVRWPATGHMVKWKQEDYVRLHKIVTGLSVRGVWEHLVAHDGGYTGLLETIPDEFHGWVKDHAGRMLDVHSATLKLAQKTHLSIFDSLPFGFTRGDYAAQAKTHPTLTPFLFALFDGNVAKARAAIWKTLKPAGHEPMKHISEDVA